MFVACDFRHMFRSALHATMRAMTHSTFRDTVSAARSSLLVWCAIAWLYTRRDPVRLF